MTAYTPRFRGVADGAGRDPEGRPPRRLLRLPDAAAPDDTDPGRAPDETLVSREGRRVVRLPEDREGATLRVLPGLGGSTPEDDLDDRPLRSSRRTSSAPLPPPSAPPAVDGHPAAPLPTPVTSGPLPVAPPVGVPSAHSRSVLPSAAPGALPGPPSPAPTTQAPPTQDPRTPVPPSSPPAEPPPLRSARRARHGGAPETPEPTPGSGLEPDAGSGAAWRQRERPRPQIDPAAAAPAGTASVTRAPAVTGSAPALAPPAPPSPPGPVSPPAPASPAMHAGGDILPGRRQGRGAVPALPRTTGDPTAARPPARVAGAATTVPVPDAVPAAVPGTPEEEVRPARSGARHRAAPPVALVRRRTRRVVTAAAAAAVVLAVLLWAVEGGLASLSSPALAVESVGGLAGMVGSALLALLVVLVAGVPAIESAFGRARLQRWHVAVGATSFALVVGHAFLAVAASALVEDDSVLEAAWRSLSDFPATTLAAVALALLVLVVVTSRAAARASRARDAWHLLHLYGYLGVFLALPHLVVTAPLPGALYWLVLYLVAAGAVVVWRVHAPLARSLRHQLVVSEVLPESDTTVAVVLRGRRLDELGAAPGSVVRLRFLDGRRWFAVHPAAVQSSPVGSRLQLSVVRAVGDGRPAGVATGTWVLLEGPSPAFTASSRTRSRVAVLAAGTAMAPLRALLEDLSYDPGDVVVVHRVREAARAPFRDDLANLAHRRGVEVIPLEGPRAADRASWLPADAAERIDDAEAITHLVADIAERDVYVSGPPEWMALVLKALRAAGVPADSIHADTFVT